jgi:hypothetical protein
MRPSLSFGTDYCALERGIGLIIGSPALGPYLPGSPSGAWGTKRLISGYNGPAINITVGATTIDVPFSTVNDFVDLTTLYGLLGTSVGKVNTVYDQTGNGHNVTGAAVTAGALPIVVPPGYNIARGPTSGGVDTTQSGVSNTNITVYGIPNIYMGYDEYLGGGKTNSYFNLPAGISVAYNNSSVFIACSAPRMTSGLPIFELGTSSPHILATAYTSQTSATVKACTYGNSILATTNCTPFASASTLGLAISSSASVLYQNGMAYYSGAGSATTTAVSGGWIGATAGPSSSMDMTLTGFCVYPTSVTSGQAVTIDAVMRPGYGGQANNLLIGDGDSIMFAQGGGFALDYLTTTIPLLNRGTWDAINVGIGGIQFQQISGYINSSQAACTANINAMIAAVPNWSSYTNIIYLCNAGVNDLHNTPNNGAGGGVTTWNTVAAPYYTSIKGLVSGGSPNIPQLKVVAMTIGPNAIATLSAESGNYNGALIAASGTGVYDAYVELGGTGTFASGGNSPYTDGQNPYFLYGDNAHLSPCGYQAVASFIAAKINSII